MRRSLVVAAIVTCAGSIFISTVGCRERDRLARLEAGPHEHQTGARGGTLANIGPRHHAEIVFERGGRLHLHMLGLDVAEVAEIESQELTAFVAGAGGHEAVRIALSPSPQVGDTRGRTSRFTGELPDELTNQPLHVMIPSIKIAGRRYRVAFAPPRATHAAMPSPAAMDEQQELYLTPRGKYTEADIEANGRRTSSEAFRGFVAEHDSNPRPGDAICPVTRTKANPQCAWVIDGQTYTFCCPPCVDEFVKLAKERPSEVAPPGDYVRR